MHFFAKPSLVDSRSRRNEYVSDDGSVALNCVATEAGGGGGGGDGSLALR